MVETSMERGNSILTQSEPIEALATLAPSFDIVTMDLGINARVKEIEATNMEE
jgi:hypothetical protein